MIVMSQGRYTGAAIASMMERPEDRAKEVKRLIEAAGGRFIASYFTYGEYDFLVISEFDDIKKATPGLIAAAAGGAITGMRTTVGLNWNDAKEAFGAAHDLASSFRSAGQRK